MSGPPIPEPASSDSTSSSLLERIKAKDPGAWRQFVRLYGPLVFHWCTRMGVRHDHAADVGQEVFRAVAQGIGSLRRDRPGDTFRGWLFTVTRNKARDFLRAQASQPEAAGGSEHQKLLAEFADAESERVGDDPTPSPKARLVARALDLVRREFTERTWRAFWRTTVEQERPADVAADLGMTAMAVRQAKSRVLRRLREDLTGP